MTTTKEAAKAHMGAHDWAVTVERGVWTWTCDGAEIQRDWVPLNVQKCLLAWLRPVAMEVR